MQEFCLIFVQNYTFVPYGKELYTKCLWHDCKSVFFCVRDLSAGSSLLLGGHVRSGTESKTDCSVYLCLLSHCVSLSPQTLPQILTTLLALSKVSLCVVQPLLVNIFAQILVSTRMRLVYSRLRHKEF